MACRCRCNVAAPLDDASDTAVYGDDDVVAATVTCCACNVTSFVLRTTPCADTPCASRDALLAAGTGYQLLGAPGWYEIERLGGGADARVLLFVVQLRASGVVTRAALTFDAPFGHGYVNLVRGDAVFLFVGVDPADPYIVASCCVRTLAVRVCGGRGCCTGCPLLVLAPGAPCPSQPTCSDVVPTALIVGALAAPAQQLLLALLEPILLNDGERAVLCLSHRPCAALTPDAAGDDLVLTFRESFPGLAYILLQHDGAGDVAIVAVLSMLTLEPLAAPFVEITLRGGAARWPGPTVDGDCCVLTMYCVLCDADVRPRVEVVSSVSCTPLCEPCGGLRGDRGDRAVPAPPYVLALPANCCEFALAPVVLTVTDDSDLVTLLTTASTYTCVGDVVPLPTPPVEFTPAPGPYPACAQANAATQPRAAKLVAMSTGELRLVLPAGGAVGDLFGVVTRYDAVSDAVAAAAVDAASAFVVVQLRCVASTVVPGAPCIVVVSRATATARTFDAATDAEDVGAAWRVVVPADAAAQWQWWRDDRALFVWAAHVSTPLRHVVTAAVSAATALFDAVPSFLRPSCLLLPDAAVTPPATPWWRKPATGALNAVLNAGGGVTVRRRGGVFPLGSYFEGAPVSSSPIACLGACVDVAAHTFTVVLLAVALVSVPFDVSLAALTSARGVARAAGACSFVCRVMPGISLNAGTVLACVAVRGSADVQVWTSTSSLTWGPAGAVATATLASPCPDPAAIADNLSFVVTDAGMPDVALAQCVLSSPWRATGEPATTCGAGALDLASYDARVGALALQAPDELLGGRRGACAIGALTVADVTDVPELLASTPALWATGGAPLPLPAPYVFQLVQPGDLVIIGMQRVNSTAFAVALVTTRQLLAGSSVTVTLDAWFSVANTVQFSISSTVAAGTVSVLTLVLGSIGLPSDFFWMTVGDAPVAFAICTAVNVTTALTDPYDAGAPGFVTLFASATSGIASASTDTLYTPETLPARLAIFPAGAAGAAFEPVAIAATTATQRTTQSENMPAENGGAWVAVVTAVDDANVFQVIDWSGVGTYVYNTACIAVLPAGTSSVAFASALMQFESPV